MLCPPAPDLTGLLLLWRFMSAKILAHVTSAHLCMVSIPITHFSNLGAAIFLGLKELRSWSSHLHPYLGTICFVVEGRGVREERLDSPCRLESRWHCGLHSLSGEKAEGLFFGMAFVLPVGPIHVQLGIYVAVFETCSIY